MAIQMVCDKCRLTTFQYATSECEDDVVDYNHVMTVKMPESFRLVDVTGRGKRLLCQKCQNELAQALKEF